MTDLPDDFCPAKRVIVLSALTARMQALTYAPMKGDDRHWFLAFAKDQKNALVEAGVPASVMDAQDAKHGDGS